MNRLKELRLSKNLSQSQLSAKANVPIRVIQTYEIGARDINKGQAITIYKLAQALDRKMEDLIELEKE